MFVWHHFVNLLLLIPVLAVLRALIVLPRASFRKRTSIWHEIGVVTLPVYILMVCSVTLNITGILNGHFSIGHGYNLRPFAGLQAVMSGGNMRYMLLNILGNIVMFAPLGFLLPLLFRGWNVGWVLLIGVGFSVLIETLQFFTSRGTDIDDVILNALGAVFGYFVYWIFRRVAPRAAGAFYVRRENA